MKKFKIIYRLDTSEMGDNLFHTLEAVDYDAACKVWRNSHIPCNATINIIAI